MQVLLCLVLCFFIGHSMTATVLRVCMAAYDSLLVSVLSYPSALSVFLPERAASLAKIWRETYGECNWHKLGPVGLSLCQRIFPTHLTISNVRLSLTKGRMSVVWFNLLIGRIRSTFSSLCSIQTWRDQSPRTPRCL